MCSRHSGEGCHLSPAVGRTIAGPVAGLAHYREQNRVDLAVPAQLLSFRLL
jgi:hypothetical protein